MRSCTVRFHVEIFLVKTLELLITDFSAASLEQQCLKGKVDGSPVLLRVKELFFLNLSNAKI